MTSSMKIWSRLVKFTSAIADTTNKRIVQQGAVSKDTYLVPPHIRKPDYSHKSMLLTRLSSSIELKNKEQIKQLKDACVIAKNILAKAKLMVEPGVTTEHINGVVHSEIIKCGAFPSPLSYKGFPKSCCTSVNNVVCHGIPDDRPLLNGDIINIDITVFVNACHGDTSDTFAVGKIDKRAHKLILSTQHCLKLGIQACVPGNNFSKIGCAIEKFANSRGFSVCKEFVGHGIGSYFHGPPNVLHTTNSSNLLMKPGMAFTIEPILMEGSNQIKRLSDGWTIVSKDNLRSAQAEHTVLITDTGVEILT
uniref:Methionine aminopeptidase n=1 Tax=Phallusia mammillata TaxID=59560 RepID=A0A6F9DJK7_9ASCI|nr:methionine aminopeptidase 1D, mitochondrial-like [Phallusia mammillata]